MEGILERYQRYSFEESAVMDSIIEDQVEVPLIITDIFFQ
jgi:hypothetical protein